MREYLYRNLTNELRQRLPAANKPQVRNLALLTQALVFSENCHLPNLALAYISHLKKLGRISACRGGESWKKEPIEIHFRRINHTTGGMLCHVLQLTA